MKITLRELENRGVSQCSGTQFEVIDVIALRKVCPNSLYPSVCEMQLETATPFLADS